MIEIPIAGLLIVIGIFAFIAVVMWVVWVTGELKDRGAYDELNTIDPIIFKVSREEWDKINKALNEPAPPHVTEGLRRLFGKHEGKDT